MARVRGVDDGVHEANLVKRLEDGLFVIEGHGVAVLPLKIADPDDYGCDLHGIRADLDAVELPGVDAGTDVGDVMQRSKGADLLLQGFKEGQGDVEEVTGAAGGSSTRIEARRSWKRLSRVRTRRRWVPSGVFRTAAVWR